MTTKVASLDDFEGETVALWPWSRLGDRISVTPVPHISDVGELAHRLEPFEIIVAMRERTPITRDLVRRLPNLRLLVTTGPGNAALDLTALAEHGVTVSASCYSVDSTVEMTWALLLAAARRIPAQDRAIKAGRWDHLIGPQLYGRTLGLVGLGRIGSRAARVAQAFGMRVTAWSENLTAERCAEVGVELATREGLFGESDFVSVHILGSERARGYVTAADIARMKKSAYFVNTSRGFIVDEAALVDALAAGAIAGAGLDVFVDEPLPEDHPLRGLGNTVLTPHSGYVAVDLYEQWGREIVHDIETYLNGEPANTISPEQPFLDMARWRWGSQD
ncbi:D-2-hydroxyacid dehydrogenase family protein [Streptomyces sp. cg40]|uniref:D-2-hydroxyacid dehydrogenase family protein n=1 Tax=Streptomyces sp. cg40 TaxID=3419764 RepID=UPI003D08A5D9